MEKKCIFCQTKNLKFTETSVETENFKVIIGIALVAPGHCMIIPKKHNLCMADIPDSLNEEYLKLKKEVTDVITEKCSSPIIIEHGVFGQSVFHGHIHFIPSASKEYSSVSMLEEMVLPSIKKHKIPYKITDFKGLKNIFKKDGEYFTIEEKGRMHVLKTKNFTSEQIEDDINYRIYFTSKGLKGIFDWKKMTSKDHERDKLLIQQTKEIVDLINKKKEMRKLVDFQEPNEPFLKSASLQKQPDISPKKKERESKKITKNTVRDTRSNSSNISL